MKPLTIDWNEVRERLRVSEHALAETLAENPTRIETVYRKRAALLGNGRAPSEPRRPGQSALVFRLHQERYAIELNELAEVFPLARCTPVPGAPATFLGVINLRGELRPIVDLGRFILRAENETTVSGFVLMLRQPGHGIGLKVDQVEGVREIIRENSAPSEHGKYTTRIAGETLVLLDVARVLAEISGREGLAMT